ncbi:ATP-binding protein [Roseospirillum parvum]|uniref:histidine kinase n=1 Tax=Roseospirillum parvum TaxID=83401 RepID=A0A1G8DP06_9PROT|nr:ATP-binding protein [Roseospirillum parvum]SDH59301.1 PAS fold-containing protein [Roseospirillum parvum]
MSDSGADPIEEWSTPQAAAPAELDLSECEREPIQFLGSVQPHGCLLVVAGPEHRITHASANTDRLLAEPAADLLGQPLLGHFDKATGQRLTPLLTRQADEDEAETVLGHLCGPGHPETLAISVHRTGGRSVVEIEPLAANPAQPTRSPGHLVEQGTPLIGELENTFRLADRAARQVAERTGYDRVMVYMFHPDWSGEVIAEVRRPDMVPYVGLRYPASDIPSQARALYTINLVRAIVDVNAVPVPILADEAALGRDPPPLDLTRSQLRAVSPYHIEYMRNMEVAASLTGSVMVNGELWGMIACHHRHPRPAPPEDRALICQQASELAQGIEAQLRLERFRRDQICELFIGQLQRRLANDDDPVSALLMGNTRLLDSLEAQGGAVAVDRSLALVGRCPPVPVVQRALDAAASLAKGSLFVTDDLGGLVRWAGGDSGEQDAATPYAGFAVLLFSRNPVTAIAVFRPPETRDVFWAGDPSKPATQTAGQTRISPRQSFAAWKESVRGRARPWEPWAGHLMLRLGETLRGFFGNRGLAAALGRSVRGLGLRFSDLHALPSGYMDASGEGVMLTIRQESGGLSGDIRLAGVNQAFLRMFDAAASAINAHDFETLRERIGLPANLHERAKGGPVACECWSRLLGRRALEISAWNLLTVHDNNETRCWDVLSFRDVTAFQRTAEALTAARDQALMASRAKSEFLANVSHELRTPLNAIIGFSDMIQGGMAGEVNDKVREYSQTIGEAGRHLLSMINDLLDLSQIEAGRRTLNEEMFDLAALARDCRDWMQAQPRSNTLSWDWNLPAEPLPMFGDRRALRQVIVNLLSNALKFTADQGEVGLSLSQRDDGTIILTVRDTGIGIAEDQLLDIFLPFQRGNAAQVSMREGSGLGLAMVKALVELHGGRVDVASIVGVGSSFQVSLPGSRAARPEKAAGVIALPVGHSTGSES